MDIKNQKYVLYPVYIRFVNLYSVYLLQKDKRQRANWKPSLASFLFWKYSSKAQKRQMRATLQ